MKFKSNSIGQCPFCNGTNLDYGSIEVEDDLMCYYSWFCPDCDNTGEEWYYLRFAGHNVNTETCIVEITDDMIGDDE